METSIDSLASKFFNRLIGKEAEEKEVIYIYPSDPLYFCQLMIIIGSRLEGVELKGAPSESLESWKEDHEQLKKTIIDIIKNRFQNSIELILDEFEIGYDKSYLINGKNITVKVRGRDDIKIKLKNGESIVVELKTTSQDIENNSSLLSYILQAVMYYEEDTREVWVVVKNRKNGDVALYIIDGKTAKMLRDLRLNLIAHLVYAQRFLSPKEAFEYSRKKFKEFIQEISKFKIKAYIYKGGEKHETEIPLKYEEPSWLCKYCPLGKQKEIKVPTPYGKRTVLTIHECPYKDLRWDSINPQKI